MVSRELLIIYLHGFNSSPASYKAGVLMKTLAAEGIECLVPELPSIPAHAIAILESLIEQHKSRLMVLIGSSLGGYYAVYLAEKFDLKAVLINPAIRPYELLQDHLGDQQNIYTGERFVLTREHLGQLIDLDVKEIAHPQHYLLLVQTGDELLDYQQAVKKFDRSPNIIIQGGSHRFDEFENVINDILSFIRKFCDDNADI